MMYDNATAGSAMLAGNVSRENRPLESLAAAVQRVNTATVRVQNFLDRFHGEGPAPSSPAVDAPDPVFPHGTNIQRLFEALDRLETRVDALNQIG